MHIILLLLGVLCVAAGIVLVVWDIPAYPFEVANALIMRGMVAIIGGLVLVGLGSVISHLRRIREAVEAQSLAPVASATPAAARPDLAQAVMAEATRTPIAEPPRSEKAEGVPAVAPPAEDAPRTVPREVPAPKPEWPRVDATDRFASEGASADSAKGGTLAPAENTQSSLSQDPPKADAEQPAAAPKPTILKSGVIEGIPYTAYSDGSFEADFAEGTQRFASFKELRMRFASRGIS